MPGTVGAKPKTNRALASQISAPLSSCVPPFPLSVPNSTRLSNASKVSGTDAVYGDLLEPILSPPVSSGLGEIEFGRKPLFESDCFFTAAALNPGMLKQAKVIHINHLHVSLAHAHASVLQATARQHGFRLTEELVFVLGVFDGKAEPGANCSSCDGARQEADGACPHRHRGPYPGISRGITVRRYVRGQRLPPPAPIRHP